MYSNSNTGTYTVTPSDADHAIAMTSAKLDSMSNEGLDASEESNVVDWDELCCDDDDSMSSAESGNILNQDALSGLDAFVQVLKQDGEATEASGKYINPQKPQHGASATGGAIFPDAGYKLGFVSEGLLRDMAVGSIMGGAYTGINNLGKLKKRSPQAQAIRMYLNTDEGRERMSSDPEFAAEVINNYSPEYGDMLSGVDDSSPVANYAKSVAGGVGRGAVLGGISHYVRRLLGAGKR